MVLMDAGRAVRAVSILVQLYSLPVRPQEGQEYIYVHVCRCLCDSGTDGELVAIGVRTCTHVSRLQTYAFVIIYMVPATKCHYKSAREV